jgi:hypothetical protein
MGLRWKRRRVEADANGDAITVWIWGGYAVARNRNEGRAGWVFEGWLTHGEPCELRGTLIATGPHRLDVQAACIAHHRSKGGAS